MGGWGILLFILVYPFAEFMTASWVADQIGWTWVFVLLGAALFLGVFLMRVAGANAFRALSDPGRRAQAFDVAAADGSAQTVMPSTGSDAEELAKAGRELGSSTILFIAGMLVAVPGFLTSGLGLVLALPPIRTWLTGYLSRRAAAAAARSQGRVTVIRAESAGGTTVFHQQTWTAGNQEPDAEGSGPRVISGEILGARPVDEGSRSDTVEDGGSSTDRKPDITETD